MELNERDITLVLDRSCNALWIDTKTHKAVIWGVTGIERSKTTHHYWKIKRAGAQIGIVWDVTEVKEKW